MNSWRTSTAVFEIWTEDQLRLLNVNAILDATARARLLPK
jgi:hypothetical protein